MSVLAQYLTFLSALFKAVAYTIDVFEMGDGNLLRYLWANIGPNHQYPISTVNNIEISSVIISGDYFKIVLSKLSS